MPADLTQDILNSDVITLLTRAIPNPELIEDETADDSNKTFTVDSGEIWEILWIYTELATTSTVGNRHLTVRFTDASDDIIFECHAKSEIVANDANQFIWLTGISGHFSLGTNKFHMALPSKSFLPAGYKIQVLDKNAVDAAADDLIIHMMINRYDV